MYTSVRPEIVLADLKESNLYPKIDPVDHSIPAGPISGGTSLSLQHNDPNSTIYYTLNGDDPRLPGGGINAAAQEYTNPINLFYPVNTIKARAYGPDTSYNVVNHAIGKPSVLSSNFSATDYQAINANDGELFGILADRSMTRPKSEYQPWWEVDLQQNESIHKIKVWYSSELGSYYNNKDVYVFVSDSPIPNLDAADLHTDPNIESIFIEGISGDLIEFTLPDNYTGQYVRVMMGGQTQTLWLAEVEVLEYDYANPIIEQAWSATHPMKYYLPQNYDQLSINEIHYNPKDSIFTNPATGLLDTIEGSDFEFIELKNSGNHIIFTDDIKFTNGVRLELETGAFMQANEILVYARNENAFQAKYGFAPDGTFFGSLKNSGEHIAISDPHGNIIDSLTYDDGNAWPNTADKGCYSLALVDANSDNSQAEAWDIQVVFTTPGEENIFLDQYQHPYTGIQINEIHYHPLDSIVGPGDTISDTNFEFLEIKNSSAVDFDLSGFFFARGIDYTFPQGSIIPAGSFLILAENDLLFEDRYGFTPFDKYGGKLSNSGEALWLVSPNGQLMDHVAYLDHDPWAADADGTGVSLGFKLNPNFENDNPDHWGIQIPNFTPGAENEFCSTINTNVFKQDLNCFEDQSGYIQMSVVGDFPPYTFNWSNGSNSSTLSGISAGTYYLSITDANACEHFDTVNLTQPEILELQLQSSDQLLFGTADGTITTNIIGGTGPYTFNWSNGATTQDLNQLDPGTYTLSLTDDKGCTKVASTTIAPVDCSIFDLSITATDETAFEAADGTCTSIVTGGAAPYQYLWSNNATSQDIQNLTPGTYYLTVTDNQLCTMIDSAEVTSSLTALIWGFVKHDINANGTFENDEPGMNDVDIFITDSGGQQLSVKTDSEGYWESEVIPGLTLISIDQNSISQSAIHSYGLIEDLVVAQANNTYHAGDDGFYEPAYISGHVFFNINNNGSQEANEPDLEGIAISVSQYDGSIINFNTDVNGDFNEIVFAGDIHFLVDHLSPNFPKGAVLTNGDDDLMSTITIGENRLLSDIGYHRQLSINLKVFLEGSLISSDGQLNYLDEMRTDINNLGVLPGQTYIGGLFGNTYFPSGQPYYVNPWNYAGTEGDAYDSFGDPNNASASYPSNVVDWVLVSFRSAVDPNTEIIRSAMLLYKDGQIAIPADWEGNYLLNNELYIVVEHLNHLPVMSHEAILVDANTLSYDFTLEEGYKDFFGLSVSQKYVQSISNENYFIMFAGNADQNISNSSSTDVNVNDKIVWEQENNTFPAYSGGDLDASGDVNVNDKILWELNNNNFSSVPR